MSPILKLFQKQYSERSWWRSYADAEFLVRNKTWRFGSLLWETASSVGWVWQKFIARKFYARYERKMTIFSYWLSRCIKFLNLEHSFKVWCFHFFALLWGGTSWFQSWLLCGHIIGWLLCGLTFYLCIFSVIIIILKLNPM